jgi:hypothetical protein
MLEVHRLPRIGTDPGRHEHEPGQEFAPGRGRVLGQELPGLLGEVEKDRIRVEDGDVPIDDGGRLGVRVDGQEGRFELLTLSGIDRHQLVRQPALLEKRATFAGLGEGW